MMNAKKLKSLDANTSGNQKQSTSIIDVPDFLNKYGDAVVAEYLRENPMLNFQIDDPLKLLTDKPDIQNAAHRVTGKIQILPSEIQEAFHNDIIARYLNLIEYLNSTGTNDLMVTSEDLKAEVKRRKTVIHGQGGYSAFADDTVINTAEVNVTKRPFTKSELEIELDKVPDDHVADIKAQMEEGINKHLADQISAVQQQYEESRAIWHKKIMDKDKLSGEDKQREYNLKKNELNERERDRIDGMKAVAQLNKARFNDYFDYFESGKGLEIPFTEDDQLDLVRMSKGVFLSFDINMNKPNPWIPSNVMLKFATELSILLSVK